MSDGQGSARDLLLVPADARGVPLGRRGEIVNRLKALLPGIAFDAAGGGSLEGNGYSLQLDLGSQEMVSRIHVRLRGGAAALKDVERLSERTGWRVIDRSEDALFDRPGQQGRSAKPPKPSAQVNDGGTVRLTRPVFSSGRGPRLGWLLVGVVCLAGAATLVWLLLGL